MFRTWYSNGMPDQRESSTDRSSWPVQIGLYARDLPSPAAAVTERIEARRATLPARRHDDAPAEQAATCDGWGVVPVLASDGAGYEPAACLGCTQCGPPRHPMPGVALRRMIASLPKDLGNDEDAW